VLRHELVHVLRVQSEDTFQEILGTLKSSKTFKIYLKNNSQQLLNLGYNQSALLEEITANYIAENITDKSFWNYIASKNDNVFNRFYNAVKYYFNLVKRMISTKFNYDSKEYKIYYNEIFKIEKQILAMQKSFENRVNNNNNKFSLFQKDVQNKINNLEEIEIIKEIPVLKKVKEIIASVGSSATRGFELLNTLLDWSLVNANKLEWMPEEVNVEYLCNEAVELMQPLAKQKNIELKLNSFENEALQCFSDMNMMRTVLRNLISNALKFTARGGKITA